MSTHFILTKPHLGATYSSGNKMPLGKLDPRLGSVHVNSASGSGIVLVGRGYEGVFTGEAPEGLAGYMLRKSFKLPADVPENGVLLVKFVYGEETVGDLDGYEIVNNQLWYKVHLDLLAKWDFRDIRIAKNGTAYPYEFISKVDGQYAKVAVKITEALSKDTKIYFYTGNNLVADASTTFLTKIDNVVGAWTMDEEDREVDPIVIVGEDFDTFWNPYSTSPGGSVGTPTIENVTVENTSYLKLTPTIGTNKYAGIIHQYSVHPDWSTKSRMCLKWYGSNTGKSIDVLVTNTNENNNFIATFNDNFIGEKIISIPFTSFVQKGTPVWSDVNRLAIRWGDTIPSDSLYVGSLVADIGVPVTDYSGNGNHGTATSTTIESSRWAGKTARRLYGNGLIELPVMNITGSFTRLCWFKRLGASGGSSVNTRHVLLAGLSGYRDEYLSVDSDGSKMRAQIRTVTPNFPYAEVSGTFNDWELFGGIYNDDLLQVSAIVGATISAPVNTNAERSVGGIDTARIGAQVPLTYNCANGVIAFVCVIQGVISQDQLSAFYNGANYPNPKLEAGKIYVHGYVHHAEPTSDTFGEWTSRRSYGVQSLHPSQGDCKAEIDWANRCLTISDVWVRNNVLDTDKHDIYTGQAEFWTPFKYDNIGSYGVVVTDVEDGVKFDVIEGEYRLVGAYHDFGSAQNWDNYDFVCCEIEGCNSGEVIRCVLTGAGGVPTTVQTFTDDFEGKRILVFSTKQFDASIVQSLRRIYFNWFPTSIFSFKVNRVWLCNGNWATLSVNIPDVLQENVGGAVANSWEHMEVWLWNITTEEYIRCCYMDGANYIWRSTISKYLDGSDFNSVYGETETYYTKNCAVQFIKGKRGETKGKQDDGMADRTVEYDNTETKYAKAVALKLKPNAGDYSVNTGGNQVKMQFKIYFK